MLPFRSPYRRKAENRKLQAAVPTHSRIVCSSSPHPSLHISAVAPRSGRRDYRRGLGQSRGINEHPQPRWSKLCSHGDWTRRLVFQNERSSGDYLLYPNQAL